MIGAVARKLFGSSNDRRIRTYRSRVDEINALEPEIEQLSDEALRARTEEFKKHLASCLVLPTIGAFGPIAPGSTKLMRWSRRSSSCRTRRYARAPRNSRSSSPAVWFFQRSAHSDLSLPGRRN